MRVTASAVSAEQIYWLALRLVPGLGMRRAVQLIRRFQTPEAIFTASRQELEGAGLSGSVAQSIASGCTFDDAAGQEEKMRAAGAEIIPYTDPRYPAQLREIYDPPVLLFARGRVQLLESLMLAIVGTRRPTPYGVAATERLSADLAQAGLTIVSGMARGIDTAAHRSVLVAGGDTVAVFGCGVDLLYPTENRKLMEELATKGLLLSEFPMGYPAYPQNFPVRNRVISGLSLGVLIIEGAQYSGSAITARMALEHQREVFSVPGNITSKMSWGPNLLIKQGAKLVQEWNDVIVELPPETRRALLAKASLRLGGQRSLDEPSQDELTPAARTVFGAVPKDAPVHHDRLLETFQAFTSSEITAALFELEMLGLIRQLPGRNFVKVW